MQRNGFSLLELIAVIALISVLLAIAMFEFNGYSRKSSIDSQARALLADLMTVRSQAMYEKRRRAVQLTDTSFAVYSSGVATGTPILSQSLRNAITPASVTLYFDSRGVFTDSLGHPVADQAICIEPNTNPGRTDSLIVSSTRILAGKRSGTFAGCNSANITIQ